MLIVGILFAVIQDRRGCSGQRRLGCQQAPGVPVVTAAIVGSPVEVSVPVVGWLIGGLALAYGGYQTVTGAAKEVKAYRQMYSAATTPAHDCTLGANLTRFWRGVVPFADTRWSGNWLGELP